MHRYLGIVGGALMAFILATGLIMGTMFTYFSDVQRQQLKTETEMAALAVDALQTGYLEKLPEENYRVTWISSEGQVLYDSDMAASQMENHLEREEVQAAMRKGYGESQRYSGTMTVKMLYSAQRLADGSVLRLSMPQQTILMVIWDMALPIGFILLVVIGVSVAIAARETKKANQEETEAMRREFTANVSHELKTPLTSISGYSELIEGGMAKGEDAVRFAGEIQKNANFQR